VVPEVEELTEGAPEELVLENARLKARAGLEARAGGAPVLGADTEVVLDGRTLGKPDGPAAARRRLEALSGRTHTVLGGVVVLDPGSGEGVPTERCGIARTDVGFRELAETTIDAYVASGEWRDRAGAYAIQGLGSILVRRIEGDFSNVVGLPLRLLLDLVPELAYAAGGLATERPPSAKP